MGVFFDDQNNPKKIVFQMMHWLLGDNVQGLPDTDHNHIKTLPENAIFEKNHSLFSVV